MLSGVTVSCFLLSYLVVLLMEASRIVLKVPGRNLLLIGMLFAGLLAHSIFLVNQVSWEGLAGAKPHLLSNWFEWLVLGAWGLALAALILTVRNPNGAMGLFLIPMVLALIGLALLLRDSPSFQPETTLNLLRAIHGVSLLVSTMFIAFGSAFGLMYLVQSHRLKTRRQKNAKFQLPTLEFLQSMNRLSLFASATGLAIGLISGVIRNLNSQGHIAWLSGSIVFPFALFVWVLMAALLEFASRGKLGGRKSAYLVIANFIFLAIVLAMLFYSSHGQPAQEASSQEMVTTLDSATRRERLA